MFPIVGLRYRCLSCFNLDLCQNCFFSQRTAKRHKLKHPMQEYSGKTTSSDDARDFAKMLKNKLKSSRRQLAYLPIDVRIQNSGFRILWISENKIPDSGFRIQNPSFWISNFQVAEEGIPLTCPPAKVTNQATEQLNTDTAQMTSHLAKLSQQHGGATGEHMEPVQSPLQIINQVHSSTDKMCNW